MDPLLEEELGLIRVSVGIEVGLLLFNVDFELEVEPDFRDFLAFLLGLTTMTPRASFCSLERRGGGGGERKYTSRSIRGGNIAWLGCCRLARRQNFQGSERISEGALETFCKSDERS